MVFPNPLTLNSVLSFTTFKAAYYRFDIIDLLGNKLVSLNQYFPIGKNNISLDEFALKKGMYFISLNGNSGYSHAINVVKYD